MVSAACLTYNMYYLYGMLELERCVPSLPSPTSASSWLTSRAAVHFALEHVNTALDELKIRTLGVSLPLFQLTRLRNLKKLDLRWSHWRGKLPQPDILEEEVTDHSKKLTI